MADNVVYRDGGKTTEEGFYKLFARLLTAGFDLINASTSLKATQRGAGANMSIDVAAGFAQIAYSTYVYHGFSDAVKNLAVAAANGANPRNDIAVVYIDRSVVSSLTDNNLNALKFMVVTGTPAASPVDPSDPTIQTAVGGTNPWIKIARILVPAASTSVVDANITDLRKNIAFKGKLWGGSNNTDGHTIPNVADGTIVTTSDVGSVVAAMLGAGSVTPAKLALGPQVATVATNETTTSTTFADLTTVTDTITVTVGANGVLVVNISADFYTTTSTALAYVSFALSGANTLAAADARALVNKMSAGSQQMAFSLVKMLTGLNPGSTTIKMKYRVTAGTGNFANREISAVPL